MLLLVTSPSEEGLPTSEDHPERGLALLTGPVVVDLLVCRSRFGGARPCYPARQLQHLGDSFTSALNQGELLQLGSPRSPRHPSPCMPSTPPDLRLALAFHHRCFQGLHRCDFAGQPPLYREIDTAVSRHPTCYVEITSFKLIHFSAFAAAWRRGRAGCGNDPGPALGKKLGINLG
jgi:hypothetical protein